jgi:O-antigen ligase
MKKENSKIIIFTIFLNILLLILRFTSGNADLFNGNLFSIAIFVLITTTLLYFFFRAEYDYFIITWLSFYFACPIINLPFTDIGSLGILNAIFIPLLLFKSTDFKNKYFLIILGLITLTLLNLADVSLRIIISRIFLFTAPFIFFYFVIKKCKNSELIIWSSIIITLINVPLGIYELILQPDWGTVTDWRGVRIFGNLFWHNSYSFYLIPPLLILYSHYRKTKNKLSAAGFLLLSALNIFTFSRNGLITLILGLLILEWISDFGGKQKLKRVAITTILIFGLIFYSVIYSNLDSHLRPETISERTLIWSSITPYLEGNLILGNGVGSYEIYRENFLNELSSHNFYLTVLFEIGLIGLIIFLSFIFLIFKEFTFKEQQRIDLVNSKRTGTILLICILIFSFVGNAAFSQVVSLNAWIILGTLLKYNDKEKD